MRRSVILSVLLALIIATGCQEKKGNVFFIMFKSAPNLFENGVYANGVMIGHGASEFGLDFLTSFFPQSAVSARVFLAAGQVPRLLESLRGAEIELNANLPSSCTTCSGRSSCLPSSTSLKPRIVSSSLTYLPGVPVNCSATKNG